jgi:AbrB family looped-hinge helix DNA binding protein
VVDFFYEEDLGLTRPWPLTQEMPFAMVNGMGEPIITIDKAGRLVLPKVLRDRFRLRPGSRLEIVVRDDHLELHPMDQQPALVRVDGWWVHQGTPDDEEALLDAVGRHRGERLEDLGR